MINTSPSFHVATQAAMSIPSDFRFALRLIARRRAFSGVAIAPLGLGVGAATAIYAMPMTTLMTDDPS